MHSVADKHLLLTLVLALRLSPEWWPHLPLGAYRSSCRIPKLTLARRVVSTSHRGTS